MARSRRKHTARVRRHNAKLKAHLFQPEPVSGFCLFEDVVPLGTRSHKHVKKQQRIQEFSARQNPNHEGLADAMRGPQNKSAAKSGYIPFQEICTDWRIRQMEVQRTRHARKLEFEDAI